MKTKIRALALYLPQYHPIEENDEWWGKGFTEWTNVVKGKSILKGQYQPHLPQDLGYYDLRLEETRIAQARLAKENGISGFCYYHYWFDGQLLLETPLKKNIENGTPDFPFCICWANENWSRSWDGKNKKVLMKQNYSISDYKKHIEYLCQNILKDNRYISVDGKPLIMIYRPSSIPNIKEMVNIWRETAKLYGFDDLYLGFFWSNRDLAWKSPELYDLDFAAAFAPNFANIKKRRTIVEKVLNRTGFKVSLTQKHDIYEYRTLVEFCKNLKYSVDYKLYPGITPMWDNYVRRQNGGANIYLNSSPTLYKDWLQNLTEKFRPYSLEENFIFINAWNEWAEGNHLEPCEKWGMDYLNATKEILEKYK